MNNRAILVCFSLIALHLSRAYLVPIFPILIDCSFGFIGLIPLFTWCKMFTLPEEKNQPFPIDNFRWRFMSKPLHYF